jgi:hypothetical protein
MIAAREKGIAVFGEDTPPSLMQSGEIRQASGDGGRSVEFSMIGFEDFDFEDFFEFGKLAH